MLNSFEPYLQDKRFLKEMDLLKLKEQLVKITVLDWAENPIKEIQGKITGGSLNLDGKSSIRRTCNLTMFVEDYDDINITTINNLISINKKMQLAVGIKNTTGRYKEYPIIWYPLGIYVMINPSISRGLNGTTVSIQLKDKMCLLNGVRCLWYNQVFYSIDSNNDIQCPVEGLVDYTCDIMKGYYAK